jgi:hypothetical protein
VDDELNAGPDCLYSFDKAIGHQDPIKPSDPRNKGSSYNVLVQRKSGEETYESLNLIIKDDPITLAAYAKDINLLDTPGWMQLKHFVRHDKKFQSKHHGVQYKFGVQVPWDWRELYPWTLPMATLFGKMPLSQSLLRLMSTLHLMKRVLAISLVLMTRRSMYTSFLM